MLNGQDDALLTEQLQRGDTLAFKALHGRLYHHIRFFCEQIVQESGEAEDIATNAFLKYWERCANFNSVSQIRSFLYIAAKNACLNYLKSRKAARNYQETVIPINVIDEQLLIEQYTYEAALFEKLYEAVELLPPQCREACKLYYFSGLSRQEIAERLSISINTVNKHCADAVRKLRIIFCRKELLILLFYSHLDIVKNNMSFSSFFN
ncbi:RNA polymerase sigma factor [Longitalea luteola]|uniref:RNA polymerase sigma factor n=1 Tax=Longitalea luteola TaxID=2812563 RepID=UPI001A979972|nr:RNA polymerase sigma-70 factor [Longitalea luteola]